MRFSGVYSKDAASSYMGNGVRLGGNDGLSIFVLDYGTISVIEVRV